MEPAELPIACSLDAGDLRARLAEMGELGRSALVGSSVEGGRAELRFDGGEAVRRRVEELVAAEADCCGFLTMRVRDEYGAVVWALEAPPGAEGVLEELVAALSGGT